jgi:hypothetical protein
MAKKKKKRELREIPLDKVKPGPLRHKKGLSQLLERISRLLYEKVGHFVYPSFEQWEVGFMRDMHPWKEILIWENIARTFDAYMAKHVDADGSHVVGNIVAISLGQVAENEPAMRKELRELYSAAFNQRWTALTEEPFGFPDDSAVVLQFEDVVDEWDGGIHPNLRRQFDPRQILAQADIILGQDVKSDEYSSYFGDDRLEDGQVPTGMKSVVVVLDSQNEKTQEAAKLFAVVEAVKGR